MPAGVDVVLEQYGINHEIVKSRISAANFSAIRRHSPAFWHVEGPHVNGSIRSEISGGVCGRTGGERGAKLKAFVGDGGTLPHRTAD